MYEGYPLTLTVEGGTERNAQTEKEEQWERNANKHIHLKSVFS